MGYTPIELAGEIVRSRLQVLYRLSSGGGLLESNEPGGPGTPAPLAHVSIGQGQVVFAVRAGLPDTVAARLRAAFAELRPVSYLTDRTLEQKVWRSVESIPLVAKINAGPCYSFPAVSGYRTSAVRIDSSNSDVLLAKDQELAGRLFAVSPCYAVLVDGSAVSICHTSRVHGLYREAGVDTSPVFRRRGYGTAVVAGWARELVSAGFRPLYSTDWDNAGSLLIAAALHLELAAVDIEIE